MLRGSRPALHPPLEQYVDVPMARFTIQYYPLQYLAAIFIIGVALLELARLNPRPAALEQTVLHVNLHG